MSEENVEIVRRGYEAGNVALAAGDYTFLEALCHPDVAVRASGMFPETGEYHGYDGVRGFIQNQAEAFEAMSVEPVEFIGAGDQVVVSIRFGGRARHTGIRDRYRHPASRHGWRSTSGGARSVAFAICCG